MSFQPVWRRTGLVACVMMGWACVGSNTEPSKTPETTGGTTQGSPSDTMSRPANAASISVTGTSAQSVPPTGSAASTLSDAEIAQIAGEANEGEMSQGRYAVANAKSAPVKRFAEHMVSAHGDIGRSMTEMVKRQNIVPAASAQSMQIHTDGQKVLDAMKESSSADFDRTYMAAQVKEHQGLLDALDSTLIPTAHNAELKASLQKVRPMVAEHLKEAQDIQASLSH